MKFLLNLLSPSVDSLLSSFTRTAERLEALAERKCRDADVTRQSAAALRSAAADLEKKADASVEEACRAVRAASRINALVSGERQ